MAPLGKCGVEHQGRIFYISRKVYITDDDRLGDWYFDLMYAYKRPHYGYLGIAHVANKVK